MTLTSMNTEYSVSLGQYVKKFLLQGRGTDDIKIAFEVGKSGTEYFTLKGSSVYFEDFVHGPITLYMQSPANNVVIEIVAWTARD